ncbi:MAG: hypothetical protein M1837_002117 [Sclerophora amabilis]|nr:MAG: hypothetical protein M1837_002117 [Sclerophora amabilis]
MNQPDGDGGGVAAVVEDAPQSQSQSHMSPSATSTSISTSTAAAARKQQQQQQQLQLQLQLPMSCEPPGTANNPVKQLVWIVFGATGHMGRSLIRKALAQGDLVTAVGRTFESSHESMQDWHERCLGVLCDVRVRETVADVIRKTRDRWGRIDVIAKSALPHVSPSD